MTVHVNKRLERTFAVFHPSDFSQASNVAFAHALKIALQSKADLDLMHVEPSAGVEEAHWVEFPGVRSTLARWGVLPDDLAAEEVGDRLGIEVRKIVKAGGNPLDVMLAHLRTFAPDLIVLSTHQRATFNGWLHGRVAEPLARRSGAMTLFVPQTGRGFVSPEDGGVRLRRLLVPIDHVPRADAALARAWALARGLGCETGAVRLMHVGSAAEAPPPPRVEDAGWSLETVFRDGDVVQSIMEEEARWEPDLMVLATQGHQDFLDALRGSTTERVVRGARCPVLAVPERSATPARL